MGAVSRPPLPPPPCVRAHLLRASRAPVARDGGDELRHRERAVHARAGLRRGDVLRLAAVALGSLERLLPRKKREKQKKRIHRKKHSNSNNNSNKHGVSRREISGPMIDISYRFHENGNESKRARARAVRVRGKIRAK